MSACYANQGPSAKRVRPAPMGRAFRVLKRTAHLTVRVSERPAPVVRRAVDAPKRRAAAPEDASGRARAVRRKTGAGRQRAAGKKAKE